MLVLPALFVTALLAACVQRETAPAADDPISYSVGETGMTVEKKVTNFPFSVTDLEKMASECGTAHQPGYFAGLAKIYADAKAVEYRFVRDGMRKDERAYTVTLLPNLSQYKTLADVKKDFDQCWVAGDAYPFQMNDEWMVFQNSCGSGAGMPGTCDEAKEKIGPTIVLKD